MDFERKETPGILIWRAVYPYLIYLGISVVVQMIVIMPQMVDKLNEMMAQKASMNEMVEGLNLLLLEKAMFLTVISSLVTIPVLAFFYFRDKKYWPVKPFVERKGQPLKKYVYIVILSLIVSVASENLFDIIGIIDVSETYNKFLDAMEKTPFIWEFVAAVVAAPLVEELVFRGLLHKRLRRCLDMKKSALISAFAFGITHGNFVQFVYAFIVGLLLAYIYELYNSLWAAILFHACNNMISAVMPEYFKNIDNYTIKALIVAVELALVYGAFILLNKRVANKNIGEE